MYWSALYLSYHSVSVSQEEEVEGFLFISREGRGEVF